MRCAAALKNSRNETNFRADVFLSPEKKFTKKNKTKQNKKKRKREKRPPSWARKTKRKFLGSVLEPRVGSGHDH